MKMFSKKPVVLMASLLLAVCLTVGGTLAYLVAQTGQVTNTFTPSAVKISVTEKVENGVKSDVRIANTGDTAAYIRAAVVITWQDAEGNVYGKTPVAETDYTIVWNAGTNADWQQGADDFYYYKQSVVAGGSTDELITSCAPVANRAPEGYSLAVEIIGSAIQAEGQDEKGNKPIELAWGVDIEDGKLKTASIVE